MGFWHTGYLDFHEPTGFDPPFVLAPVVYRCPLCSADFSTQEACRRHRFEAHPFNRPILSVKGMEIGDTEFVISEPLTPADVGTLNASSAAVNGCEVTLPQLAEVLRSYADSTVVVKLSNKDLSSAFRLRFDIAVPEDVSGVERTFQAMAKSRRLDMRAIEEFIQRTEPFRSARRYADGICDYLYGVLAKEGARDATIGYDAHREKFNRASRTLTAYRRPLSSVIRGLVALNFNQFREAVALGHESRIALVATRYIGWLDSGSVAHDPDLAAVRTHLDSYLTDRDIELILQAALQPITTLLRSTANLEEAVRRDISDLDRAKLRVLLAEVYIASGRVSDARRHALELRNTHAFGGWATRLTEAAPRLPQQS